MINQGDIFWVELDEPTGSSPGYRHPHVVIQNNVFNRSRINTVVVCALTSNLQRAAAPGNVLLEPGEADLSKQSRTHRDVIQETNPPGPGWHAAAYGAA